MTDKKGLNAKDLQGAATPPAPTSNQKSSGPAQVKLERVPVVMRFTWTPGTKADPTVTPLTNFISDKQHIAGLEITKTVSDSAGSAKLIATGLLPTAKDETPHVAALERDLEGKAHTLIVYPGTQQHDLVVHNNPVPAADKAKIDLKHANVDFDKIREGHTTIGESVLIKQSHELGQTLLNNDNYTKIGGKVLTIDGEKYVSVKQDKLNTFVDKFKEKVGTVVQKTSPADHTVSLKSWAGKGHFGREMAEAAPHAEQRNQLLEPDSKHEIAVHAVYTIATIPE